MVKCLDLVGEKFGKWSVVQKGVSTDAGKVRWVCLCSCGTQKLVVGSDLKGGKSTQCRSCSAKSAGNVERLKGRSSDVTHGMSRTRFYNIWLGVLNRCSNGNKDYQGRGIKVCDRWLNFEAFKEDMYGGYKENLTIDRVDNNGNYEPSNCRWATHSEQARNTRRNKLLTYKGDTMTLVDWCEVLGLKYHTVKKRLNSGWGVEDAFEKVKQKNQFG